MESSLDGVRRLCVELRNGKGSALFALAIASLGAAVLVVSCQGGGYRRDIAAIQDLRGQEPEIRVRVKARASGVTIDSRGRLTARAMAQSGGRSLIAPVSVSSGPSGVELAGADGQRASFPVGADVEITGTANMLVDGLACPGRVEVSPRWKEGARVFDMIATMPMEAYVEGVVGKEMYAGWPRQAYEAQAVAARSYAMHERARSRKSGKNFDIEVDTRDQAFGGVGRTSMAGEAAKATRGKVLTYTGAGGGGVLRAYYSSTCGGRPASAAEIWPTTNGLEFNLAAPLQGRSRACYCQGTQLYAWEAPRKVDELTKRLRAWGRDAGHKIKNIDRLRAIEPISRNEAGRPNLYRVTDVRGATVTMSAEELRVACNVAVPGPSGGADAFPPVRSGAAQVKSNDLEFYFRGEDVLIRGRGFGHGVGMCQFCAKGMAEKGMDWTQMARVFYPGASVESAY